MKECSPGESYLFSAAQLEEIVESLPRLSGAKWREPMSNSVSEWKAEGFNSAPLRESKSKAAGFSPLLLGCNPNLIG